MARLIQMERPTKITFEEDDGSELTDGIDRSRSHISRPVSNLNQYASSERPSSLMRLGRVLGGSGSGGKEHS